MKNIIKQNKEKEAKEVAEKESQDSLIIRLNSVLHKKDLIDALKEGLKEAKNN